MYETKQTDSSPHLEYDNCVILMTHRSGRQHACAQLEAAGFDAASDTPKNKYDTRHVTHVGGACRALWQHLCQLDSGPLERWQLLTVGELVSIVAQKGERFYREPPADPPTLTDRAALDAFAEVFHTDPAEQQRFNDGLADQQTREFWGTGDAGGDDRFCPPLIDPNTSEVADKAARALADSNQCEAAWFQRGCIDALSGLTPDDEASEGEYREAYSTGYMAVRQARNKVGV